MGQLADNEKDITGMGIKQLKNGIYVGDFLLSQFNGKGMLVADNNKIANCKNCHVYIGEWFKGKKQGYGICYNINGDIIYSGNFNNDKPTDTYPSTSTLDLTRFSSIGHHTIGETGVFHGETINGVPNGFGIFICDEGQSWFGEFKNGEPNGVGMLLLNQVKWVITNVKSNGTYKVINSYNAQLQRKAEKQQIDAENKDALKQELKQYMSEVSSFASSVAPTTNNTQQVADNGISQSSSRQSSSSRSTKSKSKVKAEKNECGTAWRSDERVYDNYDDQLVDMLTYPEKFDRSHFKEIQRKMRSIREKWEAKGCHIFESPRESKNI